MVGLGEVLWDQFPSGRQLGGAPANFAYMAHALGNLGVVASRVGSDELGEDALRQLARVGIDISCVQVDREHPTGTVSVAVDAEGQPEFTIANDVAWDFLEWTSSFAELAASADVICFGSLAQRSPFSRTTIRQFLDTAPNTALSIFDVNLRQSFHNAEILHESLGRTQVVKLNHEELPRVATLLGIAGTEENSQAVSLRQRYGLRLVCVTRGVNGSLLLGEHEAVEHAGLRVRVEDTVGAGDAFTACLADGLLRGFSLSEISERANRFASWVASQHGGMPAVPHSQTIFSND